MSLRMATADTAKSTQHITYINSGTQTGMLAAQIRGLIVPKGQELSHVHVFSSLDNTLALNVFSFSSADRTARQASRDDAKAIYDYVAELKAGKHSGDPLAPKYSEIFSEANLDAYLKNITPSYANKSIPRRFCIQKEMYERVKGTEGAEVHVEPFDATSSWVTVAAANVLPEVLLRLCSSMIAARGLDVSRAHLDSVLDETNNLPDHVGNVTMVRLLVSSKDVSFHHPSVLLCQL